MLDPPKTIFIFAYYSFKDPIFQSAVLPYFKNLSDGDNLRFVLLTFEQSKYKMSSKQADEIRDQLKKDQILWYQTNWHSGRFKIIKKAFDFMWGIMFSAFLIIRNRPAAIYSEGFPGAIIAHHLAQFFALPHIIHTYEPHTDYMIEAGVWSLDSWEARLLRKYEIKVAKGARYILTGTNAMLKKLKLLNIKAQVFRVPSCVDLSLFKYSLVDRLNIRKQWHINENDCVITYLGKFDGMYMKEEIFEFFCLCKKETRLNFKFFILTPMEHVTVIDLIKKFELNLSDFIIKTLIRSEVPAYLSASDFGFCGIRQIPSRIFSSPIKNGEYWACGLPILIPKGISDDYIFAEKYSIGIVIENMSKPSLENTIEQMKAWLNNNDKGDVVKRCREFVEKDRAIEKYKKFYRKVFLEI